MTICIHGVHTHHCPICMQSILDVTDYGDPKMVKEIEHWGAVYWHRYAGNLWAKLVESERRCKVLREELEKWLQKNSNG